MQDCHDNLSQGWEPGGKLGNLLTINPTAVTTNSLQCGIAGDSEHVEGDLYVIDGVVFLVFRNHALISTTVSLKGLTSCPSLYLCFYRDTQKEFLHSLVIVPANMLRKKRKVLEIVVHLLGS